MAPLQQARFGAAAGTLGKCENKLFDQIAGCNFQNSEVT
jgi:hypothetical protein